MRRCGHHRNTTRRVAPFYRCPQPVRAGRCQHQQEQQAGNRVVELSKACFPYPIERELSDNGSEFKAAFGAEVAKDGSGRWLTYPRTPKMNAHVERFNGSIQEEFVAYHKDLLFTDVLLFNENLLDYLVWFYTERPHYVLG